MPMAPLNARGVARAVMVFRVTHFTKRNKGHSGGTVLLQARRWR